MPGTGDKTIISCAADGQVSRILTVGTAPSRPHLRWGLQGQQSPRRIHDLMSRATPRKLCSAFHLFLLDPVLAAPGALWPLCTWESIVPKMGHVESGPCM